MDGSRLNTLLAGSRDNTREEAFLMHYPHSPHRSDYFTCYRHGDWKVIYHYIPPEASENSHYQLYNLAEDISKQNDVSMQNLDRTRAMLKQLGTWDVDLPHPVFLEGAVWKHRQLNLYDAEYQLTQPNN